MSAGRVHWLNQDPLDFVKRDLIAGAVVELGSPPRFVGRDRLGIFDRASVLQVGCDPRGSKSVAANSLRKACLPSPSLHHAKGVAPRHATRGNVPVPIDRAEEGRLLVFCDASGLDIAIQIRLGVVAGRDDVLFAAFLVEPKPRALPFLEVILNLHRHCGRYASKTIDHEANQRPVTEPNSRFDVN